jgi:hypothetical protein
MLMLYGFRFEDAVNPHPAGLSFITNVPIKPLIILQTIPLV